VNRIKVFYFCCSLLGFGCGTEVPQNEVNTADTTTSDDNSEEPTPDPSPALENEHPEISDQVPKPYLIDTKGMDLPKYVIPEDNPMTVEGVALGQKLFEDPILSLDSTKSCSSCHIKKFAYSDNAKFSEGINKQKTGRNSMSIANALWGRNFFWDGRAKGLEVQALGPIQAPGEMGETLEGIETKLNADPEYVKLFKDAFSVDSITANDVAKAISQYERTLIFFDSKFDRVQAGSEFFTESELLGYQVFFSERGECHHCHGSILMTTFVFNDNGLDLVPQDLGLGSWSGYDLNNGQFRAPTLRNIVLTAPYMHDGRFATLEEIIEHYDSGVKKSKNLDVIFQDARKLNLTDAEKVGLVDFLNTLTSKELAAENE